jgi:hypothetical protein
VIQVERLGRWLDLQILPDAVPAGPIGPLDLGQAAHRRQAGQQPADRIFAVRIDGQDLAAQAGSLLPLGAVRVDVAEPAQHVQPEIL